MAVVGRWLELPVALLAGGRAEPYLVAEGRVREFRDHVVGVGATWREVDIGNAASVGAVVDGLKGVLPFPDWCGSGWDSIEDAFEELRQGWRFPVVVAVRGLRLMLATRPHLGLEVAIRLSELSRAFSVSGDQFIVIYAAERWE